MVCSWEVYLKVSAWMSEYSSVDNLLRYLKHRKTGSEASRDFYGRNVYAFCLHTGKLPNDLVGMKKSCIEKFIEEFCYKKREDGCCARSVNTTLFMLKTFFRVNGFRGSRKIEVESFHQPVRLRTRKEYIPTLDEALRMANVAGSLRDRAMFLFLVSTGLRNSTLRAVLYGEVREQLDKGVANIMVKVHADMKKVVPSACKGNIEYSIFTSEEATEALRLYIRERRRQYGEPHDQELLFPSEYNQLPHRKRVLKPLTDRQLQVMVKKAARKAGIKEWMYVTPHCLRKTFESVLRSRLSDGGRLDIKTQEYFMGHILAGSMDTYYNKSNVDQLRKEYAKLVFKPCDEGKVETLEFLRVVAEALGVDCVQVIESKRKELSRNLDDREKLGLLQEAVKRVVRQLRNTGKSDARALSVGGLGECASAQGSAGQTLLVPNDKQVSHNNSLEKTAPAESPLSMASPNNNKRTCTMAVEQERRTKSLPLTSYMLSRESSPETKPPSNNGPQKKSTRKANTDLLSFQPKESQNCTTNKEK